MYLHAEPLTDMGWSEQKRVEAGKRLKVEVNGRLEVKKTLQITDELQQPEAACFL